MTALRAGKYSKAAYQTPQQFPSVYREDGPNFVEFTKQFYAWLDTDGPGYKARRLFEFGDIDETLDSLLPYFIKKYMWGVPTERLGDKRFALKHILDVYRSKGSLEGLKLLFRLLYGETPSAYVPSRDVLKASDGVYKIPRYFEVTYADGNPDFAQAYVVGSESGAKAIVEDYVTYRVRGREVHVMYLSNIDGDFQIAERILTPSVALNESPYIIGSPVTAEVIEGIINSSIGDRYSAVDGTGKVIGAEVRISDTTTNLDGILTFSLESGGYGYTITDPIIVISVMLITEDGYGLDTEDGYILDFGPGSGASLSIGGISNTSNLDISFTIYMPYENDLYSDATILYHDILKTEINDLLMTEDGITLITDSAGGLTINDNVTYGQWEAAETFSVGTISSIVVSSLGSGWVVSPTVVVRNDFISSLLISDGAGGYWGDDAVIEAMLVVGEDFSSGVKVIDSGFGYGQGDLVTCTFGSNTIIVRMTLGAVGYGIGDWTGTEGMLNADKYVHDSFYYQEYSYDVRSSMSLDSYEDVLRAMYHPVGTELFGTAVIGGEINEINETFSEVTQT